MTTTEVPVSEPDGLGEPPSVVRGDVARPVRARFTWAAPSANPWRTGVLIGALVSVCGLAGFTGAKLAGAGGEQGGTASAGVTAGTDAAGNVQKPVDVDPCSLLTQAETEEVLGAVTTSPSGMTCRYTPTTAGAFAGLAVAVNDKTLRQPSEFRTGLEVIAKATQATVEPVSGVGDEAYLTRIKTTVPLVQLAVRKGDRIFSVLALGGSGTSDGGASVLTDLAKKAASRF